MLLCYTKEDNQRVMDAIQAFLMDTLSSVGSRATRWPTRAAVTTANVADLRAVLMRCAFAAYASYQFHVEGWTQGAGFTPSDWANL